MAHATYDNVVSRRSPAGQTVKSFNRRFPSDGKGPDYSSPRYQYFSLISLILRAARRH